MSTLEELSARALARDPAQPAIEFQKRWYSWGEMRRVADSLAAAIEATGAPPRASIAFIPRNRPWAIAALLGMIAKGHTIHMIYGFQSAEGIARDIDRVKAAIVVAEDIAEEVRVGLARLGSAAIALQEFEVAAVPGLERSTATMREISLRPHIEILTSGTTGPPKRFPITYDMIAEHLVGVDNPFISRRAASPAEEGTPLFLCTALGNISGIYSTLPGVMQGRRAVLLDRFNVSEWHDYVVRYRPERSGMPPAGVQMVLDAKIPRADLASLRSISVGAAPIDPTVQRAFEQHYDIPILISYGATEFGGPATYMTPELHAEWGGRKFGSAGRPIAGAQLRVIDPKTGEVLPPSHEGILEVIVPRMGANWIRTADLAVVDEDGFLFHRGRMDGAIMRGGFKLLPESIEQALLLHDAISAAGVVGIPDKRLGQVPAAAVQFKPGVEHPSVPDLEKHLRNHVLATHLPVAWRFVEELPKTPSFKIDRQALKELFGTSDATQDLS